MDQIQPEVQWTALTLLVAAGGLLLTWIRAAAKWVGTRLFDEETGYVTKIVNRHISLIDAVSTVPESMKTLAHSDEQQSRLLRQIVENQGGHDAKLDAIIDIKACANQAFIEYLGKNEPQAMECLRKAAGHILKAKEN